MQSTVWQAIPGILFFREREIVEREIVDTRRLLEKYPLTTGAQDR
jgi:hypothetical protein